MGRRTRADITIAVLDAVSRKPSRMKITYLMHETNVNTATLHDIIDWLLSKKFIAETPLMKYSSAGKGKLIPERNSRVSWLTTDSGRDFLRRYKEVIKVMDELA